MPQALTPRVYLLQDKREKQDKLAESNLYIKNLDDSQTDDKLRQLFEVSLLSVLPCSQLYAMCRSAFDARIGMHALLNCSSGAESHSIRPFQQCMHTQASKVIIIDLPFRPGQQCMHTQALKVIMMDRPHQARGTNTLLTCAHCCLASAMKN